MVRIRRITTDDPLYPQELALREEIILRPIGLDLARFAGEFPGYEARFEHFVAVDDSRTGPRVIGCAALIADEPDRGSGRLMQMAVHPQRQDEGIGRRLVVAVESRGFGELGLRELTCHALKTAEGFFAKLGWSTEGEPFVEGGKPHRRYTLACPAPEEPTPEVASD